LGLISKILIAKDLADDWPPAGCWFGLGGKSQAKGPRCLLCCLYYTRRVKWFLF
jgi:hypothetical protein